MPITNEKIYTIDDEPVTPKELISRARLLDPKYDADWMQTTSRAADILRRNGYSVDRRESDE